MMDTKNSGWQYPICACADLGLNYCEIGDDKLHYESELANLSDTETLLDSLVASTVPSVASTASYLPRTCLHAMAPYSLANGQTVYLSSVYDAHRCEVLPDIGIYFDSEWCRYATCFTYVINWADFGLPECKPKTFDRYINSALGHIADSELVELGCLGAHGRTGTFLACLDIAASGFTMMPNVAIAKVRAEHCHKAIENAMQEWFIACYWARHTNRKMPRKPRTKKVKATKASPVITIKTEGTK